MSAAMIARWRAIPMERDQSSGSKRPRSTSSEEDDEDDNVSLVSRTPSPVPTSQRPTYHQMDEEIASLETRIKKTNIGHSLLSKMGWKEGEGLGLHGTGRPDPIPFVMKNAREGLGKEAADAEMIEITVASRRDLVSERQFRETDEQRQAREEAVARQVAIQSEITDVLKSFYCQLCDKQYQTVAQYDEHTNSYAHHHKVREKDMKEVAKVGKSDASTRAEKERKREEKQLRKMAKAAGVKIASTSTVVSNPTTTIVATSTSVATSVEPKKGGWATVGGSTLTGGGWSKVGSQPAPSAPSESQPPLPSGTPPPPPPPEAPPPLPGSESPTSLKAPAFRSSGWKNLTHALEEPAIVDTEEHDADPRMQVDPCLPPQPVATPYWRSHNAPSPSPSVIRREYFPRVEDHPMTDPPAY